MRVILGHPHYPQVRKRGITEEIGIITKPPPKSDILNGSQNHLQSFPTQFPSHKRTICGNYLIGGEFIFFPVIITKARHAWLLDLAFISWFRRHLVTLSAARRHLMHPSQSGQFLSSTLMCIFPGCLNCPNKWTDGSLTLPKQNSVNSNSALLRALNRFTVQVRPWVVCCRRQHDLFITSWLTARYLRL